jgi:hypothetical protein
MSTARETGEGSEPSIDAQALGSIPDPAQGQIFTGSPVPLPPSLAALTSLPSLTRSDRQRRVALGAVGALTWAFVVILSAGLRPDLGSLAGGGAALVMGATLIGLALAALRRRARGLPADLRLSYLAVVAAPAAYAAASVLMVRPHDDGACTTMQGNLACLALATLVALGAGAAMTVALQRSLLNGASWRGAAAGALAGLVGALSVHLHCPLQNLEHLLFAHGAPILLFAGAGAVLGSRVGRP